MGHTHVRNMMSVLLLRMPERSISPNTPMVSFTSTSVGARSPDRHDTCSKPTTQIAERGELACRGSCITCKPFTVDAPSGTATARLMMVDQAALTP